MKNKRILAILAITITSSVLLSACSFFGGSTEEEQVVVSATPTPEAAAATATPTPTIAPDVQDTTYTSADKTISIKLPDATWSNKTDKTDTVSFESPDQGSILILHGQGEDAMASTVLPSTQDMAVSLEQADNDKVQGTDFEIQDYTANTVGDNIGVYTYVTKMLNTDKSGGALYVVHKAIANSTEYYTIEGEVKTESALAGIKTAIESFQILGDSTLKAAATGTASSGTTTGTTGTDGSTDSTASTDGTTSTDGTAASDGTTASDGTIASDGTSSDGTASSEGTSDSGSSDTSGTTTNSGGFTEEQLTNTDETRTLYRNSDGHPFVIQPDGNGNWVDFDGNVYTFATDEDAYDADGNSYYWHGEAADVYYMPVE